MKSSPVDLRCTACGACALACPVDVIKIEQHPSPIKGKVLDRFDIDMAGCNRMRAVCEACPFRAITMAPDFEMAATFDRATDLVFDMYELRIARHARDRCRHGAYPGRQTRPAGPGGTSRCRASRCRSAPGGCCCARAGSSSCSIGTGRSGTGRCYTGCTTCGGASPAAAASAAPTDYDPLTISDEDMKKLPAGGSGQDLSRRRIASGVQPPPPKA